MRILIISFQFPPFKGAGCLRVGKTAKFLSRFGHDVRVISARDQGVPTPTLPVEIDPARVTYTRWLDLTRRLSRDRGAVAAAGSADGAPSTSRRESVSLLRQLARSVLLFPDREVGWFPFGRAAALRLIESWRPDIILASAHPITPLLVAWSVSRTTGIPWVAELRDLWTDFPVYRYPEWRRRIEDRLERAVLGSAAGLVTVSEPLAETLVSKYGKPTAVIYHGFDPEDYDAEPATMAGEGHLRLVYTGNVYAGLQDPSPLFEALARLAGRAHLDFYGQTHPWVHSMADSAGAAAHVNFRGVVSNREALAAQRASDLLISFLITDVNQPGCLQTKNLEYFGAGRPILGVGPRENGAAALIAGRGAGITLQTADEIVVYLETLLDRKRELGRIPDVPAAARDGLSRENQTRNLEHFLSSLLAARQPA